MKLLMLDIEVSPTLATVWGLFNQNISIDQITGNSEILTWCAKWYNNSTIYSGVKSKNKERLLRPLHDLMEKADAIITYNGDSFDFKILNKEFLLAGMFPPSSYKSIDLYKVVKKHFRFTSNKLNYVSKQLKIGQKVKTRGHELWLECMTGNQEAFKEMLKYNKQDVILLEHLYNKLLPWITNHPNQVLYENNNTVCPTCGNNKYEKRGFHYTKTAKYQRYRCFNCGTWFRENTSVALKGTKFTHV